MANAAYDFETIYSPAGEVHRCSRLNALDLVRTAGYTWNARASVAAVELEVPLEVPKEVIAEVVPEVDEPAVDRTTSDLTDLAAVLAGTDAVAYLNGFSVDDLNTISMERYGQRLRGNISKEKAVERIMALEAARIANESTPAV